MVIPSIYHVTRSLLSGEASVISFPSDLQDACAVRSGAGSGRPDVVNFAGNSSLPVPPASSSPCSFPRKARIPAGAFNAAVEEDQAPPGLQSNPFGQFNISRKDEPPVSGTGAFEEVSHACVSSFQFLCISQPLPVGRIHDHNSFFLGNVRFRVIAHGQVDPVLNTGGYGILLRGGDGPPVHIRSDNFPRKIADGFFLSFPSQFLPNRFRKPLEMPKPKLLRIRPGARFRAIRAASIAIVPLPHIGLTKGPFPVQPVARTMAAARVSCMGALRGLADSPCGTGGSPEVSR